MKEKKIDLHGLSIAYKAWGNSENTPIIALHGWLDNANSFDLIAPTLTNNYFLIAIDLPGHGYSSHLPAGCNYHFIDGIYHVINIVEALGIDQFILLGHSMGACLASLIASIVPEKVTKLVLLEGLGPLSHETTTCHKQLKSYLHYQHVLSNKPNRPYPSFNAAVKARAKNGYLPIELAEIIVNRAIKEVKGQFFWRHDKRLLTPSPLRLCEEQVNNCLNEIASPSLLIEGTTGFEYDKHKMTERKKRVENLEVSILEGGHHIHLEQPDKTNALILDFLK